MKANFPIGILIDNFHMETRPAILAAAEIGADGIQFFAKNELAPEALSAPARAELRRFIGEQGLEISALCGDIGGFKTPEIIEENVTKTLRIIDLAKDMGTNIVTAHIGAIPAAPAHPRYGMMLDACGRVARYAQSVSACYAIETGPEVSGVLNMFLEDVDSSGIGVNLDPANFVMVTGEDPAKAARRLGKRVVHTHAKDGVMHRFVGVDIAYGMTPDLKNEKPGSREQKPLGEGSVNWREYLRALREIGYRGYLTIEREGGDDRRGDIERAFAMLRAMTAEDPDFH